MKTKNLFLATILVAFGAINENVAQENTIIGVNSSTATNGKRNVFLGGNAGLNMNGPASQNYYNVFLGYGAGQNSNAVSTSFECARNVFLGMNSGINNTSGSDNVFIGFGSGFLNTIGSKNISIKSLRQNTNTTGLPMTGDGNITIGYQTGDDLSTGSNNTFLGNSAGRYNSSGHDNLFLGTTSGQLNSIGDSNISIGSIGPQNGDGNILMGIGSGMQTSGTQNVMIGTYAGYNSTIGSKNVFIGSVRLPSSPATSTLAGNNTNNTIIIADNGVSQTTEGLQRIYIHSNGNTGIGLGNNVIPQNKLEVKHGTANNSGLRFTNLNSSFVPTTSASKFLTVDANGDVILQNVSGSGGSGTVTTITAGQNIVVTNTGSNFVISSPTSNTLFNNTNTMTSTVNGVVANAPIVNSVVNTIASGQLTTTVNGVPSAPVILPATLDSDAQTLSITGDQLIISNGNTVNLPTLTEVDGSITNELQTLTENPIQTTGTAISLSNGGGTVYVDGSETKIQAGTNVTLTGNGTIAAPYVISSSASGSGTDTSIYANDGTIVTTATPGIRTVTMGNNNLFFKTTNSDPEKGRVYIGDAMLFPAITTDSKYRLLVEGGVLTEKVKVAVRTTANWADYVFANDYKLMPLSEVETFVKINKHLPGISSADKIVNEGLDLGEMQAKQMEKIEELTLYAIEQNKKIEKQEKEIEELKVLVKTLVNKNK